VRAVRASHAPVVIVLIMAVTSPWLAGPAPTRKLDRDRLEERRGAQVFGRARMLNDDHPDFAHYWSAFRWQSDHVERSRSLAEPLVVVDAERIVYTEHWLRRDGYAPRQFWTAK
jgi:hypothetical protein